MTREKQRRSREQRTGSNRDGKEEARRDPQIVILLGRPRPRRLVGTARLHGINIMDFCKAYNEKTESQRGQVIPAEISIFEDRSFTFITKTPPTRCSCSSRPWASRRARR